MYLSRGGKLLIVKFPWNSKIEAKGAQINSERGYLWKCQTHFTTGRAHNTSRIDAEIYADLRAVRASEADVLLMDGRLLTSTLLGPEFPIQDAEDVLGSPLPSNTLLPRP